MEISIPGLEKTLQEIRHMVSQDRFPHTSLITGRKGAPMWPVAQEAIMILMCREEDGACGKCAACRKVRNMIHPDVHYSFPYIKQKENTCSDFMEEFRSWVLGQDVPSIEDWKLHLSKQGTSFNIHIAECRRIQSNLALKSFEQGPKVAVIWGAEYLGANGNRLLKLLEEPPEETYIFLITDKPQMLLTTIVSRCQTFRLDAVGEDQLAEWLSHKYALTTEQAMVQAQRAEGNVALAIDLVEHGAQELKVSPEDWIQVLIRSDFEGILGMAEVFRSMSREEQRLFCLDGLRKAREWHFFPDRDKRIFERVGKNLFDLEFVEEWSELLNEMLAGIDRNAHVAMLFTAKSIAFWKRMKARS